MEEFLDRAACAAQDPTSPPDPTLFQTASIIITDLLFCSNNLELLLFIARICLILGCFNLVLNKDKAHKRFFFWKNQQVIPHWPEREDRLGVISKWRRSSLAAFNGGHILGHLCNPGSAFQKPKRKDLQGVFLTQSLLHHFNPKNIPFV